MRPGRRPDEGAGGGGITAQAPARMRVGGDMDKRIDSDLLLLQVRRGSRSSGEP